jgi:hypothetical protein
MRQLPARVRTRTVGATASEPDAGPSDPGLSPKQWAIRKVVLDVDPTGAKACGERLSSQVRAEGLAGRTSHGSRCLRRVAASAPVAGHVRRHRQRRAGGGRLPPVRRLRGRRGRQPLLLCMVAVAQGRAGRRVRGDARAWSVGEPNSARVGPSGHGGRCVVAPELEAVVGSVRQPPVRPCGGPTSP